jgi:hypothetical protein
MKKVFKYLHSCKIYFIAVMLLLSCEKDNKQLIQEQCNCGLVVSDEVSDYSVVIRNNCSGNEKKFYLQPGDWMNAYVGSDYCITNVKSW